MLFNAEKLKTSDWVEYVLFFGAAWLSFPYILLTSLRFGFLIADNTAGHFVAIGSSIYTIAAAKAAFFCLMLFLAGIGCVIRYLVRTVARRWHRIHPTVRSV